MVLTRLEKLTFTLLTIGILVGGGLVLVHIQANRSRNRAIAGEIREIGSLTPRTVIQKDVAPPELGTDDFHKLNINTASVADLDALPGMGKAFAQRILDFRKEKGEIKDMSELLHLKGMTKKKYTTLSRLLTVKGGKTGQAGGSVKLNLNFASLEEVERLPGVGKKMAQAIIDIRNQRGTYHTLEDLEEVPGLTPEKLKKFVDLIEVK